MTTVFETVPMQLYMIHTIKTPIIFAIDTIFNPNASKLDKLKAASKLYKAFQAISKMPEPTLENTTHPNAHNLIILRDWLLGKCNLSYERMGLIRHLINFAIIIVQFDPPWRWIIDSLREESLKLTWVPRDYDRTGAVKYEWWKE